MFPSLHMGWRHVLFASWPVDPDLVRPHVPDPLGVDTYDGRAWLSVVPFTNVDVRPTWLPAGLGVRLPELNLRTYVTHEDAPAEEPGVYFPSLDADGVLGVLGARLAHHLPYYYAAIDCSLEGHTVVFDHRRRHPGARHARFRARYEPVGDRSTADVGSRDAFLTERYRYYTEGRDGELRYATIDHDPWPLTDVRYTIGENTLFRANDFPTPTGDPVVQYSRGVDVTASPSKVV